MKEKRDKEYYLIAPTTSGVIIETLKAEEEKKVRKAELAREFPFKKKGLTEK